MSQITNTVCDICGKVKGETNHWFKSDIRKEVFICFQFKNGSYTNYKDYCSQGCVTKAFQEWLNAQQEAHEATQLASTKELHYKFAGIFEEIDYDEIKDITV